MPAGKLLLGFGLALAALGLILLYAPGALTWFGRLPGDIRIDREGLRLYIPVTSMIVVSLLLTLLANLIFRR